jgi:hypothetical protein
MVREVRIVVGVLAFFGLLGSVAAIFAGGYLVYRGSTGSAEITLFGQHISTTNVGIACVFLGIVCLILVIRQAFDTLNKAIAAPDRTESP